MKFQVELWADEAVTVEVDAQGDEIVAVLDGADLDPRIIEWAIAYGFRQGIRDAAAALKEDDKRNAAAWKRIDALKSNTLREGGGGGPKLSPVEREMRAICEAQVRAAFANPANQGWVAKQLAETKLGIADLRDAVVKAKVKADDGSLRKAAEARLAQMDTLDISDIEIKVA